MTGTGTETHYYWCVKHHRVETDADKCPSKNLLGPYPTAASAEQALSKVEERNKEWKEEDDRWAGK